MQGHQTVILVVGCLWFVAGFFSYGIYKGWRIKNCLFYNVSYTRDDELVAQVVFGGCGLLSLSMVLTSGLLLHGWAFKLKCPKELKAA